MRGEPQSELPALPPGDLRIPKSKVQHIEQVDLFWQWNIAAKLHSRSRPREIVEPAFGKQQMLGPQNLPVPKGSPLPGLGALIKLQNHMP